jgi:hypothetical protein
MKPIYLSIALFAIIISLTPNALGEFGDITLTPPKMVNTTGQQLGELHVGEQIGVESTLTNHAKSEQKFTYLVQVSTKDGAIEYLEGFSASMVSNQSFTASQVWIPKESGQYTIQIFVWESLASSIPLTNVLETQITVNP